MAVFLPAPMTIQTIQFAALEDPDLVIGTALWAQRHEVHVSAPEPVVNALAQRSNAAADKQERSAFVERLIQQPIGL